MAKQRDNDEPMPISDEHASEAVFVQAGDIIFHYVRPGMNQGGWAKGEESLKLTPSRNICARALRPFTYLQGEYAKYHDVKFRVLRRFMSPMQTKEGYFPGGDIPIIDTSRPEPAIPDVRTPMRAAAEKIGRNPAIPLEEQLPVHDKGRADVFYPRDHVPQPV